jgi:hypothetical protein
MAQQTSSVEAGVELRRLRVHSNQFLRALEAAIAALSRGSSSSGVTRAAVWGEDGVAGTSVQ